MTANRSLEAFQLFHSMLVSYKLVLRELLGSGQAIFVQPVLANFARLNEASSFKPFQGENMNEAFQSLSEIFRSAGLIRGFHFEKFGVNRYVFHVDGCFWAPHIHKKLGIEGFLCPYALMAMSIFQTKTGEKVKFTTSKFLENGSETSIEVI